MKKILILLILCIIKLSAYEYIIYNDTNSSDPYYKFYILKDNNNNMFLQWVRPSGDVGINSNVTSNYAQSYLYNFLNAIKNKSVENSGYITHYKFNNDFKNDIQYLNDLFLFVGNPFFNYLYNQGSFNKNNYIEYDNYELLYNSDDLAVESIVNGQWAGLYDESELSKSGYLYNKKGEVVYKNGLPVSWMEKLFEKFKFEKIMKDSLGLLGSAVLVVLIVCGIVVLIERFTDFSLIALIGRLGK